jgi:hypothetical protein
MCTCHYISIYEYLLCMSIYTCIYIFIHMYPHVYMWITSLYFSIKCEFAKENREAFHGLEQVLGQLEIRQSSAFPEVQVRSCLHR